jgi:hypothetical protein
MRHGCRQPFDIVCAAARQIPIWDPPVHVAAQCLVHGIGIHSQLALPKKGTPGSES